VLDALPLRAVLCDQTSMAPSPKTAGVALSSLALALWLSRQHRRTLSALLERIIHTCALVGLRAATVLAMLAHRAAHRVALALSAATSWRGRRLEGGSAPAGPHPASLAVIPPNAVVQEVAMCSPYIPAPRPRAVEAAAGAGARANQRPPGGPSSLVDSPADPAAAGPGRWLDAGPDPRASDAPPLSFSFQGCAWMMHCEWG
jgi:hypothetical protein